MITKEIATVLALRVYDQQPIISENLPLEPQGWVKLTNPLPATDGFAYGVFRNATTNEVVISYRGTDGLKGMMGADGANNIGLTLGQATSQAVQAAKVYAKVLELYGSDASGSNISFTGHSLGGGLAGVMAVWFARPAFVFDPAPFQAVVESLDAKNTVWTALGVAAPQAFRDYVPTRDLLTREDAIQRHYVTGEFIDLRLSNPGNTLYGSSIAYTFGNQNGEVGMGALHSQALLAAGILSPGFVAATVTVQRALPLIMSTSYYSQEPAGSTDRNFLIDLIRSEQQTPNNSKLDHFAADLNKLGTTVAGLNDAAQKALIAQGIEWYYWQGTGYSGQEFFTQSGSVLQYEVVPAATLPSKTSKALPWVKAWLDGSVGSVQGNTLLVATPDYTRFEQWNVATGSTATAATARDPAKTQIFVGGSGADTFTGASAADLLFGNAGDDRLDGGAGADTLQGGSGADTYAFGAAWGKDLVADSDGLGRIRLDGIELQGLFTGTVNGYALDLGAGQYAGLAVVRDSASTTGYKAVIVKGTDTANTITIRDFDLARAKGSDGYLGIRLDGARKLALQGEAGANPFADLGFSPDSLAGQASTLAEGSGKTFTVFLSLAARAGDTLTDGLPGTSNSIAARGHRTGVASLFGIKLGAFESRKRCWRWRWGRADAQVRRRPSLRPFTHAMRDARRSGARATCRQMEMLR